MFEFIDSVVHKLRLREKDLSTSTAPPLWGGCVVVILGRAILKVWMRKSHMLRFFLRIYWCRKFCDISDIAEISAILVIFRPVPGPRLENMSPTMMTYPPKDARNSGEFSAHQIVNVRLIFIVLELASLILIIKIHNCDIEVLIFWS